MLYKVYLRTKDRDIFCDKSFNNEEDAKIWFNGLNRFHIGDEIIFEEYSLVRTLKIKL